MNIQGSIKSLLGVLLAVLLLGWVLRGTDPELLWAQIRSASIGLLLLSVLLNVGSSLFRAIRWRLLLDPIRHGLPLRTLFAAIIVGYMTSWVLPGRLGEVVRPLILTGREAMPLGPTLGTVVADRLLDGCAVVLLFAIGAWISPPTGAALEHAATIRAAAVFSAVAAVGFLGTMLLVSAQRERLAQYLERCWTPVRWVGRVVLNLSAGVGALRSPRLLFGIATQTMLVWLTICLSIWAAVRAVGAPVGFGAILFILPLLVLGVSIPTPGGAGSYHGAVKIGLMLFGVGELVAVSAGLLLHLAITVPVILLGMVLLWTEGISWRHVLDAAREIPGLGAGDPPPMSRVRESTP